MRDHEVCSVAATLFCVFVMGCSRHTRDGELIAEFWKHRPDLERLASMAQSDQSAETITPTGAILSGRVLRISEGELDRIHAVIPADRWAQYMDLLRRTGVKGGIFKEPNGAIDFEVDSPAFSNGDSRKGIEFAKVLRSPVLPSLDEVSFDDVHRFAPKTNTVYRQIAPGWYLWLFFNP